MWMRLPKGWEPQIVLTIEMGNSKSRVRIRQHNDMSITCITQ